VGGPAHGQTIVAPEDSRWVTEDFVDLPIHRFCRSVDAPAVMAEVASVLSVRSGDGASIPPGMRHIVRGVHYNAAPSESQPSVFPIPSPPGGHESCSRILLKSCQEPVGIE